MDAAFAFAQLATRQRYEDLPAAARNLTKQDILDTLGTTLAGSAAEGAEEIVGLARELGGKPESSIFAHGIRVPSPEAALVNGFMARSVDYDDTYDTAVLHAGSTVVPAAFAAAERKGGVSGKDLMVAVAMGVDMICRMGLAREEPRTAGWLGTPLYGYFGCALTASRLLGLSEEQTLNALGIAYGHAAGNTQSIRERALTKNLDVGCASRGGVFSALAAQRGITGAHNCLDGDLGLFKVYHRGQYSSKRLTDGLGEVFEIANLSFKPYPCCRHCHRFIDLAIDLAKAHNIKPEDVQEVVGYIDHEPHLEFHPVEEKHNPKTITDAQFSIPYCTAVALVKRQVVLDDFTESAIKDPVVLALTKKVIPKLDASLHRGQEVPGAILEIKTKQGAYTKRTDYAYGHPKNPMSVDSMYAKFRDCAAHARRRIDEKDVSKVVEMVMNLEDVKDIGEIVRLLQ